MWIPIQRNSAKICSTAGQWSSKASDFSSLQSPPDFRCVVRWCVQVRPTKVETKWRTHGAHFDHEQLVVVVKQFWNLVAANLADIQVLQAKVDAYFAVVGNSSAVKFDGEG